MKFLRWLILMIVLLLVSCNELEIEEEVKGNEKVITKTILTLWDSITAWYTLDLEDSYPSQLGDVLQENNYKYEIINAWVSWDTSEQLLERIDLYLDLEDSNTEIAILVIGWNDGLRWLSINILYSNISLVIDKLQNENIKVVLWWMQIPPNLWLKYSYDFKKLYSKIAKQKDVYLIDFFLEGVAWNRSLNLSDWIHPNKKWYEIIAKNVFEFLKSNKLITND